MTYPSARAVARAGESIRLIWRHSSIDVACSRPLGGRGGERK
jgi:hypothetical protein